MNDFRVEFRKGDRVIVEHTVEPAFGDYDDAVFTYYGTVTKVDALAVGILLCKTNRIVWFGYRDRISSKLILRKEPGHAAKPL